MSTMTEKVISGYHIIGTLTTKPEGFLVGQFIAGEFDEDVKCAIYHNVYGMNPTPESDFSGDPENFLESLKDAFREVIIDQINKYAKLEKARKSAEATANFSAMHQSHELGTVAEIAEKYGISKKKVRKMKQDGTLEDYIATLDTQA